MKRNLSVLFLALAMVATMLVSCGDKCDHTFSDNWASDANQHWHPATCEHGEIKDSLANHVDANEDGVCDVCAYDGVGHDHTFAEEWISDEYYHWHEATCSHSDELGSYGLHSDNNLDYVCDYCEGHVHAMNIIGYCADRTCGAELRKPADIENFDLAYIIYASGITGYDRINGGEINYEFVGRSNVSSEYEVQILKNVGYILGNGYTYTKTSTISTNANTTETDVLEGWYEADGNGVFGVTKLQGAGRYELVSASSDHLYGYYYALSTLANAHGAENILYTLFEISQSANVSGFEYTLDEENGDATFSYDVKTINRGTAEGIAVAYYQVSVSFKYAEQYALTSLDIVVDCYTGDAGVAVEDGFLEDDVDFDYNETTGELVLRENAKADTYTVNVIQSVGQRNAVNPHPKSSFVPESFDVFSDENCTVEIKNSVSANVGEFYCIYLGNYLPVGTSVEYVNDYMQFEVLDSDGNLLISNKDSGNVLDVQSCSSASAFYSYSANKRYFEFYPKTAGAYKFVIYFVGEKTHEITIYAGVEANEEIELGANQFAVEINEAYGWTANEVSFTAKTAGTYTFTFTGKNLSFANADEHDAAYDKDGYLIGEEPTVYYDFQDSFFENTHSFSVNLGANETIRFYATSDRIGTYVVDYSVN